MAISLASISRGKARAAPRIVLLGVEKVGKSTFSSEAPSPIFIPMKGERGIDEIDCAKFPPCQSYTDLIDMLGTLYREEHDFKTVVLDSGSALEPLIWEHACTQNGGVTSVEKIGGGFGKWKIETIKYWRDIADGLDALRDDRGMASIIIGHVKTKEFADPEADSYTQYQWDLTDNAANMLYRWADCILFANFRRAVVLKTESGFNKKTARATGTSDRLLFSEKRPAHPGGNRYTLPYELPLSWAKFAEALNGKPETKPTTTPKGK